MSPVARSSGSCAPSAIRPIPRPRSVQPARPQNNHAPQGLVAPTLALVCVQQISTGRRRRLREDLFRASCASHLWSRGASWGSNIPADLASRRAVDGDLAEALNPYAQGRTGR